MHLETPRFRAWREADRQAQAAEQELHRALVRSRTQRDATSITEAAALAHSLRQKAHALFDDAMMEVQGLAESLHHRRILAGELPTPCPASAERALGAAGRGLPPVPRDDTTASNQAF